MKNNIFKILSIILFFTVGLFFTSCEKDIIDESTLKKEVTFGINEPMTLKSDEHNIECTDSEAVTAEIMIDGFDEPFTPSLIDVGGETMTQVIKLNSGSYTVTSFKLLDVDGNIVKAMPEDGSEYSIYVSETVPFELNVPEFDKLEKGVDVLCFNESDYTNFGFNWFNVGQVEVNEILFFGDLCYDPNLYIGSLYDELFELENYPFDIPALFEIRTFVDVDGDWEELKTFSNIVDGQYVEGPVAAEWFTHSSGTVDFKFELWVLVFESSFNGDITFDYVQFDTWEFDSENPLSAENNNVIDFVIGDCYYGGTPPQFVYDPYEPIQFTTGCVPETTSENVLELFPEKVNNMSEYPSLFNPQNEVRIITGDDTEVFVEFLFEGAGWVNTFGYYTYTLGDEPTDPSQLTKTVIWPQVSGQGEGGPLTPGDRLQITTSELPENTVIGFYLVAKGWDGTQMVPGDYTHYTDFNLNENGLQQHTLFIEENCNDLVLTFEDIKLNGGDKDFNDIIVRIKDNTQGLMNQPNSFNLTNVVTL